MAALRLTATQREQLSDCRLLLAAAEHDLNLVLRGPNPDADEALVRAVEQAAQAAAGLRRIGDALRG